MARKPKLPATNLAKLDAQAKKLEAEKRWLALRAFWLQVSRDTPHDDLWSFYHMRADAAQERFDKECKAKGKIITTPTPNRCPFHDYSVSSWVRRHLKGVQPTAKRAVEAASMYDKEVTVTGNTLDGDQHTVLIVNKHGEVMFMHPQFKVKLSESGGVV